MTNGVAVPSKIVKYGCIIIANYNYVITTVRGMRFY